MTHPLPYPRISKMVNPKKSPFVNLTKVDPVLLPVVQTSVKVTLWTYWSVTVPVVMTIQENLKQRFCYLQHSRLTDLRHTDMSTEDERSYFLD